MTNDNLNHSCPHCGYCKHCGRSRGHYAYPQPYPVYPCPWWLYPNKPYVSPSIGYYSGSQSSIGINTSPNLQVNAIT